MTRLGNMQIIEESAGVAQSLQPLPWTIARRGENKFLVAVDKMTRAGIEKLAPTWESKVLGTVFDATNEQLDTATQQNVRYTIGVVPVPPADTDQLRMFLDNGAPISFNHRQLQNARWDVLLRAMQKGEHNATTLVLPKSSSGKKRTHRGSRSAEATRAKLQKQHSLQTAAK